MTSESLRYGSTVLFVDDVPGVLAFYERAFGFVTRFYDAEYEFGELDAGGGSLAFGSHACGERMMPGAYRGAPGDQTSGVEVAFYTSDVPSAYERAVAAGATALTPPSGMPWGQTVAYVRSVEGTVIGLCTPTPQGGSS